MSLTAKEHFVLMLPKYALPRALGAALESGTLNMSFPSASIALGSSFIFSEENKKFTPKHRTIDWTSISNAIWLYENYNTPLPWEMEDEPTKPFTLSEVAKWTVAGLVVSIVLAFTLKAIFNL